MSLSDLRMLKIW